MIQEMLSGMATSQLLQRARAKPTWLQVSLVPKHRLSSARLFDKGNDAVDDFVSCLLVPRERSVVLLVRKHCRIGTQLRNVSRGSVLAPAI
mmetsp:Transcript_8221/g.22601  ORF Transcript_8221/g.22601 Transcript_8221/m.22601 type:complete len:91 (+) Transcript_8221:85-357(+)